MNNPKTRTLKVWISLIASMTFGAVILLALDNQKVIDGPFSLASFKELETIPSVISHHSDNFNNNWTGVRVYTLKHLNSSQKDDYHFIVGDGNLAVDGQILATKSWRSQHACLGLEKLVGKAETIMICLVTGDEDYPTDSQLKRVTQLIESLSREFDIVADKIICPENSNL